MIVEFDDKTVNEDTIIKTVIDASFLHLSQLFWTDCELNKVRTFIIHISEMINSEKDKESKKIFIEDVFFFLLFLTLSIETKNIQILTAIPKQHIKI